MATCAHSSTRGDLIICRYILGRYTKQNAPNYLRAENFRILKACLKEKKLTLVNDSLASAIVEVALFHKITWVFSFLANR